MLGIGNGCRLPRTALFSGNPATLQVVLDVGAMIEKGDVAMKNENGVGNSMLVASDSYNDDDDLVSNCILDATNPSTSTCHLQIVTKLKLFEVVLPVLDLRAIELLKGPHQTTHFTLVATVDRMGPHRRELVGGERCDSTFA